MTTPDYLGPLRRERRLHAGLVGDTLDARARAMDLVLIGRAGPQPGERTLDVGCGAGFLVRDLLAVCDGVAATGIDLDASLAPPQVGDVRALPFEDRTFDIVFAQECLAWVEGLDRALAEIARVLRPRGRLAIGDFVFLHPDKATLWGVVNALPVAIWRARLAAQGLALTSTTDHTGAVIASAWRLYQELPPEPAELFRHRRRNLGLRIGALKAREVHRLIMIARKP